MRHVTRETGPERVSARSTVVGLLLALASLATEAWSATTSGYIKQFPVAFDPPELLATDTPLEGSATSRLRLSLTSRRGQLATELAYELSPRIESASTTTILYGGDLPRRAGGQYRIADFHSRLYPSDGNPDGSFALNHNLDRALITYESVHGDLWIGRQTVAFGSARVVSPTDVIVPFTYEELDKEERPGVDAVRLRRAVGSFSEIDVGYIFGKDLDIDASAAFAQGRFSIAQTDLNPLLIMFRENVLVGIDLARALGSAGSWLEAAYTFAGAAGGGGRGGDYLRLSTGVDYSFGASSYGMVEYHFNGAGEADAEQFLELFTDTAYAEGGVFLLGRHYITPGLSYQATPLAIFSVQALTNLNDPSMLLSSRIEYSLGDDLFAELGAFIPAGRRFDGRRLRPRSEFGLYPRIYFGSMKFYF